MNDQASSLRELKRRFDESAAQDTPTTGDELLARLPRPCPFPAIALIVTSLPGTPPPPMLPWLPIPLDPGHKAACWDEAHLLPPGLLPPVPVRDRLDAAMVQCSTERGPLWVLPPQPTLERLARQPESQRLREIRRLVPQLANLGELWVTLRADAVRTRPELLLGCDLAVHLVPDHPDAILRGYEAVKALHLAGFFSPQAVVVVEEGIGGQGAAAFARIQQVSQKFLKLELRFGGVVPPPDQASLPPGPPPDQLLPELIAHLHPATRDWLFSFCEAVLYPAPEEPLRPHV